MARRIRPPMVSGSAFASQMDLGGGLVGMVGSSGGGCCGFLQDRASDPSYSDTVFDVYTRISFDPFDPAGGGLVLETWQWDSTHKDNGFRLFVPTDDSETHWWYLRSRLYVDVWTDLDNPGDTSDVALSVAAYFRHLNSSFDGIGNGTLPDLMPFNIINGLPVGGGVELANDGGMHWNWVFDLDWLTADSTNGDEITIDGTTGTMYGVEVSFGGIGQGVGGPKLFIRAHLGVEESFIIAEKICCRDHVQPDLQSSASPPPPPPPDPTAYRPKRVVAKTANYTVEPFVDGVEADSSGGAFTVTLPDPRASIGREVSVKKTDSSANAVNVTAPTTDAGARKIDGSTSAVPITTQWLSLTFKSDGTDYIIT